MSALIDKTYNTESRGKLYALESFGETVAETFVVYNMWTAGSAPDRPREVRVSTFSEGVQGVDHELEDGAPEGGVVERGRAAPSLQIGPDLQENTALVGDPTLNVSCPGPRVNFRVLEIATDNGNPVQWI